MAPVPTALFLALPGIAVLRSAARNGLDHLRLVDLAATALLLAIAGLVLVGCAFGLARLGLAAGLLALPMAWAEAGAALCFLATATSLFLWSGQAATFARAFFTRARTA